jgi:signal transduction histidine kinase
MLRTPRSEIERFLLPAVVASLTILLAILAVLQYRWIGEIGQAERERLQAGLEAAADRTVAEVDREITRAWLSFQPSRSRREDEAERREGLIRQVQAWRRTDSVPALVRDVFVTVPSADGTSTLQRLNETAGRFIPVPWPEELQGLRGPLSRPLEDGPQGRLLLAAAESGAPTLVVPFLRPERSPESGPVPRAWTILRLDRKALVESLVAEAVDRHFLLSEASELRVAVLAPSGPVWLSDPALPQQAYLPGDVERPLLGLRGVFQGGQGGLRGRRRDVGDRGGRDDGGDRKGAPPVSPLGQRGRPGAPVLLADGPWNLVVRHEAGSINEVVARARRRNLAVSAGVLALLAASFAVLAVAAQRARRLARQRMELVAGVTHELNTPLAAIRSAGQNLADGVVVDPEQVRRYGQLVEREGKRLSALVGQALKLAGIESGARVWNPEPASLAEAVRESLADVHWLFAENEMEVETDLPADLPEVLIDRGALGLIVRNLLDNAARHASAGKWVRVRARREPDGRSVLLTIEDRGPGVLPEDRPHLFEPFYRGRGVAASATPGSGLGLDLVRRAAAAHGGTVVVGAGPGGRGAQFNVRLPAARAANGVT